MQFDIQTRGFSMTDSLLNHTQRRLLFSLTFFKNKINRVIVRLSDVNGPRGGSDKRCHLQFKLEGLPDVVIEDTEVDLYAAIDRSIDRARRAVARKVDRQKKLLKKNSTVVSEAFMSQLTDPEKL
jgi:putative sigma-54 modulation protein